MKTITLKDAMTSEILEIVFDLESDKMEINEIEVVRKNALESNEDEFVFGSTVPGDTIIYHLSREQIKKMKSM